MEPDTTKVWTPSEVRVTVGKLIVESLGVDEATVTDDAALIRDLGAESLDFLDLSFKCQQTFGVDLPVRLIQDRRIAWRDLGVLATVIEARYGLAVPADELRTVAPATVGAILAHLAARHGASIADGDERAVTRALAQRMLADLEGTPLDLSDLDIDRFAGYLEPSLHAHAAVEAVMNRFTVRAVNDYIVGRLTAASRLAPGA
jgi:acyl carrier protein